MRQEKTVEHIAHQNHHLQQQHEEFRQQQKLISDHFDTKQDHFEQQQQEMSNRFTSQQDRLELQGKLIDHLVTQLDCCEQQNQEIIGSIARKHDDPARCQGQHHALSMQHVQRACPDQVNPICQDSGYVELLIYCNLCQTSAEHRYVGPQSCLSNHVICSQINHTT
ncbi:hypothetical protein MKW94_021399 [Papaver nudicaule]|uniref:Uncharacterized protein n=1 Tax=Papaver nudicaule TaxID=74823 RepID=A0AA41S4C3_PAPNU|nr:hypothetical protein [Papaver nudicaule]